MFFEKRGFVYAPVEPREPEFVDRKAREIADKVLEKYRTGIPAKKTINIMMNQIATLARRNKSKKGKMMIQDLKLKIIRILEKEGIS